MKTKVDKKLLFLNSIGTAFAHLLNIAALVWVVQHLLKRISPEEFELLPVVSSLVVFMPIFLDTFSSGIARYVTAAYAGKDFERITCIASTMFVVNLVVAFFLMLLVGLASWQVDAILDIHPDRIGEARLMLLMLVGSSVLFLPTTPLVVGMHVKQRFLIISAITTVATIIRILVMVVLIVGLAPKVIYVAFATFIATVFTQIAKLLWSRRLLPELHFSPAAVDLTIARSILGFGVWSTLGRTANAIRQGADPLILNQLSTAIQVNTFHVGSLVDRQIRALLSMVTTPLEPIFTSLHVDADDDRFGKAFLRVTRLTLWLTTPPLIPLLVFREEFMQLYLGSAFSQYPSASNVMGLLLLTFPFVATLSPLFLIVRAKGDIGAYTRRIIFAQFANLFFTFVLVWNIGLGAIGSALATLIVTITYPAYLWPLGCKFAAIKYGVYKKQILLGVFPSALSGLIAVCIRNIVEIDSWIELSAYSTVTVLVGGILTLPMLHSADRNDIGKLILKIRSRI